MRFAPFNKVALSPSGIALIGVLAVALGLRVWGVWFGLPYLFHNDEGFEVIRALQLGSGEFDFSRVGKGGYFYLLFIEYGVLFVVLLALGIVKTSNDFALYFISDPSAFYLVGRTTTAVIGAINVYLVYRIGKLAWSSLAGLIAAALLAVNVLHASLSHYITVDVPMACLATAALLFAVRLAIDGKRRDYFLAAVFAAMATATKMPALLLVISLLVAHWLYARSAGMSGRDTILDARLWQSAGIFVVLYIVLAPGILFSFDDQVVGLVGRLTGSEAPAVADEAAAAMPNLFLYYIEHLIAGMSLPVFLVCVAGLGFGLWKRTSADIVLISFGLVMYLAISSSTDSHLYFPRYLTPIMPVLVLLGGRLLAEGVSRFAGERSPAVAGLVMVALAAWPLAAIAANNEALVRPDTRVVAKEWVLANIPAGSKVFLEGFQARVFPATIPLENSEENLKEAIAAFGESEPGKAKYFRMKLKVLEDVTYDLELVQPSSLGRLEDYLDDGVEYFVVRPDNYTGSRLQDHWRDFVRDLEQHPRVSLLKDFVPDEETLGGARIAIYKADNG